MRKLKLGPAPAPETAGERGMIISVTEASICPVTGGCYNITRHTTTTLPRLIMIIAVYNLQLL